MAFGTYGYADFSVALKPNAAFPLDARSIFDSYDAAHVAALSAEEVGSTNTRFYFGQMITVVENDVVTHYSIQSDHSLKELGSSTLGDDKTIALVDGKLSLVNFGKKYYKYIAKDTIIEGEYSYPDNMPSSAAVGAFVNVADVWYKMAAEGWVVADAEPNTAERYELVEGWKSGLTPQAVLNADGTAYELAWYEPSTVTVEGLSAAIASMQTDVTNLNTAVTKLNGDAQTEGSVDYKIAQVIDAYLTGEGEESKIDTLKDLINWAETHNTEVANYGTDIEANKQAIADLEALIGASLPEGTSATTVIDYITEVKAIADSAVKSVTAGTENGHISVDGTDVKVYELNPANVTTLGGIKPDGSSISVDSEGVASVTAVDVSKVTGLDTKLTQTKEAAVSEAKEYANGAFIPVANIVADGDAAESVEAASDGNVISEKLFLASMNWKTEM